MRDDECVEFLQWALPRLRLRWPGFRKVRRQVCRRIRGRCAELGLATWADYRAHLEAHADEWSVLDTLCHVTISRFYRDAAVFAALEREVLPALARAAAERREPLRAWSAGCASGEEPYTLALVWALGAGGAFPRVQLDVLATDVDETMLERAAAACYPASSLRDLPSAYRNRGFVPRRDRFCLRERFKTGVELRRHDVRDDEPPGRSFDLVLCRNLAFTYFDADLQQDVAARIAGCLRQGGALAVGAHEALPDGTGGFEPWPRVGHVYRRP